MSEKADLRPAVFLDRDGTLNEVVYNQDGVEDSPFRPEDLVLLPGAGEFTRRVREAGYLTVLVTNQPGVAKGSITIAGLDQIHRCLLDQLVADGGGLDRIYYCPHHPLGRPGFSSPFVQACDCRKPAPGMLRKAAEDMGISLARSWMVGDKMIDVQAGQAAGCRTIFLRRSSPQQPAKSDRSPQPTYSAADLAEALGMILKQSD
jgi:D-glycero-D-manno-heptose 1,7-bisphosphate phosphatase